MDLNCPRCHTPNRPVALFCSQCGLPLKGADGELLAPGLVPHPEPLPAPAGLEPCAEAVNLFFRWESAWGGAMLAGTESVGIALFNGGYALASAAFRIRGEDAQGREIFSVEREAALLPRGKETGLEVPSYEMPNPVHRVYVSLTRAEFASES
jgi:hypothetical protein